MKSKSKSKNSQRREKSLRETLPRDYPWKVLGWLSEDLCQYLSAEDFNLVTEICRSRDIDRLLGLAEAWGLLSMSTTGTTLSEKMARYQLAALLKKFRFPTERQTRIQSATKKLLAGEEACAWFNREGFTKLSEAKEPWMVNVFTYAKAFLQKLLGFDVPDLDTMTERSRHGPGATLDTESGHVSHYFKYAKWPYQCTSAASGYARRLIKNDERWLGALEDDYRSRFKIPKWMILDRKVFWDSVLEIVDGNRITFVPKDAKTERSIAIEPTLNLMLQLGVDGYIRRRLKRWGVDLNSQEKNQELARLGSIGNGEEDRFVTIDLANASNSISLRLCELLLPSDWYGYLVALRSPKGELNGDSFRYEMISSMGNGYTFALESALFTAIIYGVMRETSGRFDRNEFAVFGDDLIIRRSISDRVVEALANCGFAVNASKSFFEGPVRESCGFDWHQGRPVRPVFLSDTPSTVPELFSDINRIKRILELRWCIEESKTLSLMERWIPEQFRSLCGPYSDEDFDSYIHCNRPHVPYRRCVYKYTRLVRRPIEEKAPSFLFRKLMHDLHPRPAPSNKWDRKLTGFGGRFNVVRRNAYTLGYSDSVSSIWRSEYAEWQPGGRS